MSSYRETIWDSRFLVTMPNNSAVGQQKLLDRDNNYRNLRRDVISLRQRITDVHKAPLDGVCVKHQLQNATPGKVIKTPRPDLWPTRILLKLPHILNAA